MSKQVAVVQAGMPAATLTLKTDAVTLESKAGSAQVSFQTNRGWTASSDAAWLEVSPASGEGSTQYQTLTLTAQENTGENAREAKVRIQAGDKSAEVSVTQLVGAQLTISAFKSKPANTTTWYRLTGEIAAIENEEYGNFFLFDETGFVYVYGLSKTQVSKNDQTFKQLGLKVGDKLTMMTLRSEHEGMAQAGGDTPAYFVSSTPGEYKLGRKVASTKAAWMELPATKADDGQDLLIHSFPDGKRSYAAYYDYDHFVSTWVAYPLCSGNIGSGDRTEKFTLDPILPRDKQQYLPKGYRTGNGSSNERFDRGHQIASADRLDYRVNLETFFGTNMTPQDHTLNTDLWGTLEKRVRGWALGQEVRHGHALRRHGLRRRGQHQICPGFGQQAYHRPGGLLQGLAAPGQGQELFRRGLLVRQQVQQRPQRPEVDVDEHRRPGEEGGRGLLRQPPRRRPGQRGGAESRRRRLVVEQLGA